MNNPIDITSVIPIGMKKEQAIKLAEKIAKTMKVMWAAEGGTIKLSPKDFAYSALNYFGTAKSKRFLSNRIQAIFSEEVLKKIIKSKNDFVTFNFNGEQITVNAKTPQPA